MSRDRKHKYSSREQAIALALLEKRKCTKCGEDITDQNISVHRKNVKYTDGTGGHRLWVSGYCILCETLAGGRNVNGLSNLDLYVARVIMLKQRRCKRDGIQFDLTIKWLHDRLKSVDMKCELSGIPFVFGQTPKATGDMRPDWNTMSLDRIDPNGGYVQGNVRLVLWQINAFRSDLPDGILFNICKGVVNKNRL